MLGFISTRHAVVAAAAAAPPLAPSLGPARAHTPSQAQSSMPVVGPGDLNEGKTSTFPEAKSLDAHTVQVTLTSLGTYLLGELTYTSWYVVEPKVAIGENLTGPNSQARNVGTGPFMFS